MALAPSGAVVIIHFQCLVGKCNVSDLQWMADGGCGPTTFISYSRDHNNEQREAR